MDTSILEEIGLSSTEIKVFMTILSNGESKAGDIIRESGLQSSSVFNSINSLIKKGFVSYIKKSKVKYYKTIEPESILQYIEMKKERYLKLLPELNARRKEAEDEGVEYFKSFKGIRTLMIELLKDAKKGEVYRFFSVEDPDEYKEAREKVFGYTKKMIKEARVKPLGIFHEKNRAPKRKDTIMQKRYVNFPMPPSTSIINNKIAVLSLDEEPSGILIRSTYLAKKYSDFFDEMWKTAKK
jgi:sugar-specific transcriptional regulator TrmB